VGEKTQHNKKKNEEFGRCDKMVEEFTRTDGRRYR
jgi:hypothetical protein